MTDSDEHVSIQRFGTAAPGAKPKPPSLENILTVQPANGRGQLTRMCALAVAGISIMAAAGFLIGHYTAGPSSPPVRRLAVTTVAMPAGARLTRADVRIVAVSPQQGEAMPAGALGTEEIAGSLGLVTRFTLPQGTFLQRSFLAPEGAIPGPSQALVGLALKPGQLPSSGLAAGQPVQVILLPASPQGVPLRPELLATTTIWDEQGPDSSGTTEATVVVPASMATKLASYAARGEVALVAVATSH